MLQGRVRGQAKLNSHVRIHHERILSFREGPSTSEDVAVTAQTWWPAFYFIMCLCLTSFPSSIFIQIRDQYTQRPLLMLDNGTIYYRKLPCALIFRDFSIISTKVICIFVMIHRMRTDPQLSSSRLRI